MGRVRRGCGEGVEDGERVWRVGRGCRGWAVGVEGRERVGMHGAVKLIKYLRHPQV